MSTFGELVSRITKTLGGRSDPASASGQRSASRGQTAQDIGAQIKEQVRKAGPDVAQRHLAKTKFGANPRAQKAARTADGLVRRFAGTGDQSSLKRRDETPVDR